MTDPAMEHARPEAAALTDARRHVACAMTALRAVAHYRPDLGTDVGVLRAQLADLAEQLTRLEGRP